MGTNFRGESIIDIFGPYTVPLKHFSPFMVSQKHSLKHFGQAILLHYPPFLPISRNCHALYVLKPRGDGTIQDKETTDGYLKTKVDPARARCLDCISVT